MKRWPTKPLGELVDFVGGGTPRRDRPDYWGGEIPWASVKDLQSQSLETTLENVTAAGLANSASNLIPQGTVIIASRVGLGKVAINRKPVAINQDLKALMLRSSDLLPRYLLLFLLSKAEYFEQAGVGATVKGLTMADYQKLCIAVPPLAEQERIVKLLDEADELRKLRAQADRRTSDLIPALFHEMFGDSPKKTSRLPILPLGEVVDLGSGATPSKENPEFWNGGTPWVSPKDMKAEEITDTEDHVSAEAFEKSNLQLIPKDTVLIVVRGMILAHTVPIRLCRVSVAINQDMKALLPKQPIEPEFLRWSLQAQHPYLLNQVSTAGHGTKKLDSDRLRAVTVPVPPLPLQKEFAARVSDIRAMQVEQAASRRRLDDLFHSMLHRAFKEEL